MSEIVAVPEVLVRTGANVASVGSQVAELRTAVRTTLERVAEGAPPATGRALEIFMVRWTAGLGQLGTNTLGLGRLTDLAGRAYEAADDALLR